MEIFREGNDFSVDDHPSSEADHHTAADATLPDSTDVYAKLFSSSGMDGHDAPSEPTHRGTFRDRFEIVSNGDALRIRTVGDIPHLHKTWRDHADERVEGFQVNTDCCLTCLPLCLASVIHNPVLNHDPANRNCCCRIYARTRTF